MYPCIQNVYILHFWGIFTFVVALGTGTQSMKIIFYEHILEIQLILQNKNE